MGGENYNMVIGTYKLHTPTHIQCGTIYNRDNINTII